MKLSELSTEQAANVLCEIAPYLTNITGDKALMDELSEKLNAKGKSPAEIYVAGAKKLAALTPIVLRDHRADVFAVLAALNDTDVKSIAKQNVIKTLWQIKSVMQDKELLDFFKSWGQAGGE